MTVCRDGATTPDPGRILVMGILPISPDSFSGDGLLHADNAVSQAHEMVRLGAAIVDVGGASTRPGAVEVPPDVEASRVLPVIKQLTEDGIRVSVDTYRAAVAEAPLAAGAHLVNDVSGGRADADMLPVIRDSGTPWVLSHWRAPSSRMMER